MSKGVIYILTNPSFPQYVKIGYATDVKPRLDELNRSTAVPFAFRIYATYEVDSALSDKKLHSILNCYNFAIWQFNFKRSMIIFIFCKRTKSIKLW